MVFGFNDQLETAFTAGLTGTSGGSEDSHGIFLSSGGQLSQIARSGQAVPGGKERLRRTSIASRELNNSGTVAFSASMNGTTGGASDDEGIYRFSGGSLSQVARRGQIAPDGNGTFGSMFGPVLNDSGEIAFFFKSHWDQWRH